MGERESSGHVRRGTRADLPEIYEVWFRTETLGDPDPPPRRSDDPTYRDELELDDVFVFERHDGRILGFAVSSTFPAIRYLAELFVDPNEQSVGVGRALLEAALPGDGLPICTSSSQDPRALSLYIRSGMRPLWPHYYLGAASCDLRIDVPSGLDLIEVDVLDPEFAAWDAELSGQCRPERFRAWQRGRSTTALLVKSGAETIGYALVLDNPNALRDTDWLTVGPVGARLEADAARVVVAAVVWAAQRAPGVRTVLPGPHPALAALLDGGIRIVDWDLFSSSTEDLPFDPKRYVLAMNTL